MFVFLCFVLFCFVFVCVLFCFVLFCFVLFCFVLFCFVLFCFVCLCLFGCLTGGYTPAECAVLGVPSITSNLAGFGSYVEKHVENTAKNGIYVTDRIGQTWEQAAQQMAEILNNFTMMSRRQRDLKCAIVWSDWVPHISIGVRWVDITSRRAQWRSSGTPTPSCSRRARTKISATWSFVSWPNLSSCSLVCVCSLTSCRVFGFGVFPELRTLKST